MTGRRFAPTQPRPRPASLRRGRRQEPSARRTGGHRASHHVHQDRRRAGVAPVTYATRSGPDPGRGRVADRRAELDSVAVRADGSRRASRGRHRSLRPRPPTRAPSGYPRQGKRTGRPPGRLSGGPPAPPPQVGSTWSDGSDRSSGRAVGAENGEPEHAGTPGRYRGRRRFGDVYRPAGVRRSRPGDVVRRVARQQEKPSSRTGRPVGCAATEDRQGPMKTAKAAAGGRNARVAWRDSVPSRMTWPPMPPGRQVDVELRVRRRGGRPRSKVIVTAIVTVRRPGMRTDRAGSLAGGDGPGPVRRRDGARTASMSRPASCSASDQRERLLPARPRSASRKPGLSDPPPPGERAEVADDRSPPSAASEASGGRRSSMRRDIGRVRSPARLDWDRRRRCCGRRG